MNNIFEKIVDKENFRVAHNQTKLGKTKYNLDAVKFNRDETYNLNKLRNEVITGEYEFGDYISFYVYEPKERLIHAPTYRDKIVQTAINNIIKKIYFPKFISDSYSCIDKKGTLECANRVSKFVNEANYNYGEDATIIKIDIKKFFYTINRNVLKSIIKIKLKCERTLELLFKIIDSANKISKIGIPLGNTISQICSNIYMDTVDQFCKRRLSIKYYVRYADDIVIITKNKIIAKEYLCEIISFINKRLLLNVNENKTKIFPIKQGVNVVGFKINVGYRLLRNNCKKNIKSKLSKFIEMIDTNKIRRHKAEQMINSWLGHARNANSFNFISYLMDRFKYLYYDKRMNIKISNDYLKGGIYAYC